MNNLSNYPRLSLFILLLIIGLSTYLTRPNHNGIINKEETKSIPIQQSEEKKIIINTEIKQPQILKKQEISLNINSSQATATQSQILAQVIPPGFDWGLKELEIDIARVTRLFDPTAVQLGEQCGGEGMLEAETTSQASTPMFCGGDIGYGGETCNTDPQCYQSGYCTCTCRCGTTGCSCANGACSRTGCCCVTQSCYGYCHAPAIAYLWDSISLQCGCGI